MRYNPENSWESGGNRTFVPLKGFWFRAQVGKCALVMTTCLYARCMLMAESRRGCTRAQHSMHSSNPLASTSRLSAVAAELLISRHAPCHKHLFLVQNSISDGFPGITEKIIEIPAKRLGFPQKNNEAPRVSQLLMPSCSFLRIQSNRKPLLGSTVPFPLESQKFPGISLKFPGKAGIAWSSLSTREGRSAVSEMMMNVVE